MPREYHNSSGQIVLDYAKAIQESVFEQLRVVRDGQLRIVFSPDLKVKLGSFLLFFLTIPSVLSKHAMYLTFLSFLIRYVLGNFVLDVMKSLFLEGC